MSTPRLESLAKLQALERLPRVGWLLAGDTGAVESVAAHSHGVCVLAMSLAPRLRPVLDLGEVLALCTVHDLAEALLGDLPREAGELLPAGAKAHAERLAAERLFAPIEGLDGPLRRAFARYQAQESREARFARVCDRLQLALRAWVRARHGVRGLQEFRRGLEALDAAEFASAAELRAELLAAWRVESAN